MATTLLLDRSGWDLALTSSGDIAVASEPYSQAQDIASECRLFLGEAYYDTGRGIAYFTQVLGRPQPVQLLKQQYVDAAALVPGVSQPVAYLEAISGRAVSGQIQFTTDAGQQMVAL